jgi:hypothetical protein
VTTIDPTLTKAIATHRAGRLPGAKAQYQRVLRRRPPGCPEFPRTRHQSGNHGAASVLQRSVRSAPGNPACG